MLFENIEKKKKQSNVLLGYRTGGTEFIKDKYVWLPYRDFDSIGIISRTGYGKSVLLKRIYSYLFHNTGRTGIIFDLQSEDHHLSIKPNSDYRGFSKGERVFGLPNIKCYAPLYVKDECHKFDSVFSFKITDTIKSDWKKLDVAGDYGLTNSGTALLFSVLNNKDDMSIQELLDYLDDLDANKNTLKSLSNNLGYLDDMNVFYDEDGKSLHIPDFTKRMEDEICVLNFHQNEEFMGFHIGVILRNLYWNARDGKRKNKSLKPIVIIEEADLALNKDNGLSMGANKWVMEILRRARKYGFYIIISTQQASDLYKSVKNHVKTWIVGELSPDDEEFFGKYFYPDVMNAIKGLNTHPNDYGAREWCLVSDRKYYEKFYPFNSPVEIHRV